MNVQVLLFARFREVFGSDRIDVEMIDQATVAILRKALSERKPELAALLSSSRIAVNNEFAGEDTRITSTDEIAMVPPVSGG